MAAMPSETINTMLLFAIDPAVMLCTCPAKMCRSGSAMLMKKPSSKPLIITAQILFDLETVDPVMLPIGVILVSTPKRKNVKPKIISAAPRRNLKTNVVSMGITVKCRISTITVTGITEKLTSLSFAKNLLNLATSSLSS